LAWEPLFCALLILSSAWPSEDGVGNLLKVFGEAVGDGLGVGFSSFFFFVERFDVLRTRRRGVVCRKNLLNLWA